MEQNNIANMIRENQVKMKASIEHLEKDFSGISTGRARTELIADLKVDHHDASMQLSNMASIFVADARSLLVRPWDPSAKDKIVKVIRESGLDLNPSVIGEEIRVPVPMMTEERRLMLVKQLKQRAESTRIALRNYRRDLLAALKKMMQDKQITQDDLKREEKQVQDLLDGKIKQVDTLLKNKSDELTHT